MKKFFSPDNIIIKFLTLFCDWMFYNILFMLFSLPIVTMGASLTAIYSLCFKRLDNKEVHVFRTFWKEFKSNFKQSTLFWVPFLLICLILTGSVYISHNIVDEKYMFLAEHYTHHEMYNDLLEGYLMKYDVVINTNWIYKRKK